MKSIIIKSNEKVVAVAQVADISTKQYLEFQKESHKLIKEKDEQINFLTEHLAKCEVDIEELTKKCNYLAKQIAIDRGEIEEDDESEYELVIKTNGLEEPEEENVATEPAPEDAPESCELEESEEQE